MLSNKKGFTLVELLAVIVILAIILAIAVPGISGILDSARKGAFESDAKMIVTGIEYKILQSTVDPSIQVPEENEDITINLAEYGANPANYTSVVITDLDPITIQLTSSANSEFGAFTATATKTVVNITSGN